MTFATFVRRARLLIAAAIVTITFAVVAPAVQTITTANAAQYSYYLGAGGYSSLIYPVASQPVFVMGVQLQSGYRGVGQVTMLRIAGQFLEWVGLESTSGAAITQGFSAVNGTHIVYIDWAHQVDLEVYNADSFRVHNSSSGIRSGNVKLIW